MQQISRIVKPAHFPVILGVCVTVAFSLAQEVYRAGHTSVSHASVVDGSASNQNEELEQAFDCAQQPFAGLCNPGPITSHHWILDKPTSGCNLVYSAIRDNNEQTVSIKDCQAIYNCWFVSETASVCLYHLTIDIHVELNKQLKLIWISVQDGQWIPSRLPISVFTYIDFTGTISSSVGFYATMDAESYTETAAAVFLIGKRHKLYRVVLLSPTQGVSERRRPIRVCQKQHNLLQVVATKHGVLALCDNHVYWINAVTWKPVKITSQEVALTDTLVTSYMSESSNVSVVLIAVNIAGNFEYCFISPLMQPLLSHCGMIPNVLLTNGILVTRSDISDAHFLALLNGIILTLISSNESLTINTDFCYPSDNCHLLQTENRIYMGNQWKTMVLDREDFEINAIFPNAGLKEVMLIEEKALHQHDVMLSSSLSSGSPIATTFSVIITDLIDASSSLTIVPTSLISTSTDLTIMPTGLINSSTSLTSTHTGLINASTNVISTPSDLTNTSTDSTSTSINLIDTSTNLTIIPTGLVNTSTDLIDTELTTAITSLTTTSTQTSTNSNVITGSTTISSGPPSFSPSIDNTNSTDINTKSETGTSGVVLYVILHLVFLLTVIIIVAIVIITYCKCNRNPQQLTTKEVTLSIQSNEALQIEQESIEGVMVTTQRPDITMYSKTCTVAGTTD